MSRVAPPGSGPYRSASVLPRVPPDPLGVAGKAATWLLVGLALLRVGVCAVEGLDLEGLVALVVVCRSLT